MSKEEFLRILREKLSILDEKEMEDILNEYEQHIDMKTAGAMTEEEAIADFGNLDDLAADILEAYHVRSDYAKESASSGAGTWERLKGRLDGTAAKIKDGARRFMDWCRSGWESFGAFWQRLFAKYSGREKTDGKTGEAREHIVRMSENSAGAETEGRKMPRHTAERYITEPDAKRGFWRSLWNGLKRGTCSFMNGCWNLILFCLKAGIWCVKWMWNIGWIAAGAMMGIGAAFCLFFMGALLVLWSQGYPVAGMTIGMAGICLCAVSMTGLPFTFLVGLKKKECKRQEETVVVSVAEEEGNHA